MELNSPASRLLRDLLEVRTGQRFETSHGWRIEAALGSVMARHGIVDVVMLGVRLLDPASRGLADDVVHALLNNETYFFRDASIFNGLEAVLHRLAERRNAGKRLRIWSAGCSSGQELYSLAMIIAKDRQRWRDWKIELLGTDISSTIVDRARQGEYSQFEIQRGLPVRYMLRWFSQVGERWRINPSLREMVGFRTHNILDRPPAGAFDIVLCRNVLFYFPEATRGKAFDRLADALAPDGLLMLGAGETTLGQTGRFAGSPEGRGLYRRIDIDVAERMSRRAVRA